MALPIRQRLSALTCLKPGPKAVLIEVCELAENGGRGCFASNDTLAKKLGVSLATMTRTVATLVGYGLLHSDVVKAEANRRYLAPTAALRACYKGGTEAEQLAAVSKLTIVKSEPAPELTIVNSGVDYSQNGELTIVKSEADYSQNASRVLGDDQYDQLEYQDDQLVRALRVALAEAEEELAEAQKKIAQLEAEREASRTRGAAETWQYNPAAIAENLILPFDSPEFLQAWAAYRQFREESGQHRLSGGIQEQEALRHLGNLAAGSQQAAIEALSYTIRNGYKSICKPNAPRPTTQQPGQPERGAKPTVAASTGARALSAQLRAIREERSAQNGSHVDTGAAAGTNAGLGPAVPAGVGAPQGG